MTIIEEGQKLRRKITRVPRRGDGKRVFSTKLKVAILGAAGSIRRSELQW
jgi:hypothetical protein